MKEKIFNYPKRSRGWVRLTADEKEKINQFEKGFTELLNTILPPNWSEFVTIGTTNDFVVLETRVSYKGKKFFQKKRGVDFTLTEKDLQKIKTDVEAYISSEDAAAKAEAEKLAFLWKFNLLEIKNVRLLPRTGDSINVLLGDEDENVTYFSEIGNFVFNAAGEVSQVTFSPKQVATAHECHEAIAHFERQQERVQKIAEILWEVLAQNISK